MRDKRFPNIVRDIYIPMDKRILNLIQKLRFYVIMSIATYCQVFAQLIRKIVCEPCRLFPSALIGVSFLNIASSFQLVKC